ncbi:hypothetical protein [Micromonospora sp. NPDC007230]
MTIPQFSAGDPASPSTGDSPNPVRAAEARQMLDAVLTEYAESTGE